MRLPRRLALIGALLALLAATTVQAAGPPKLQGPVTDQAGVLGGRVAEVEQALDALLRDHDVQLFVLFVQGTGDLTATEFADETARANSLGANDVLLMVAMGDRTDAIWVSDALAGRLTDPELNQIIADDLEPALREGDPAGAAIATAKALGAAAEPAPPMTAPPNDGGGPVGPIDGGGAGLSIDVGALIGWTLLLAGIVIVGVWLASRLGAWREAEERDRATGRLAREANAQLLAVDDRIRAADQEAGFVEAEYGDDQAAPFRAAVAQARDALKAAFGVRQKLDDAVPEDPPTRAAMLKEIVDQCARANAALDAQAARIRELRDLEQHAEQILAALPAGVATQEARLPAAEEAVASLAGFAEATAHPVRGNVAEARKGLAGARASIQRGTASLAAADRRAAAREIATAQEGVTGATALLDAVDKLVASVREAHDRLPDELTAAKADLEAARAAVATAPAGVSGAPGKPAAALTAAETALATAVAAAGATPLDPTAAYREAASARRAAGDALAAVRQDAAQRAQLAAALETTIVAARSSVDLASDFIATRRSGVGRRARTRLAEAQASLDAAVRLRASDPAAAMDQARRADQLADEAYSLAAGDFARWDQRTNPNRGGSDVGAIILGGIIGGILSGGGRHGGWGGSPWGSSGPFGGGGGGGGMGGGGWGGGGHSVGGGFGGGGGGGHSVGGRW